MLDKIREYAEVSDRKLTLEDELIRYFDPIALKLGFNSGVEEVQAHPDSDTVSFLAVWNGSYQSEDKQWFQVPLKWIEDREDIVAKFEEIKSQEIEAKNALLAKQQEEAERKQYQRLEEINEDKEEFFDRYLPVPLKKLFEEYPDGHIYVNYDANRTEDAIAICVPLTEEEFKREIEEENRQREQRRKLEIEQRKREIKAAMDKWDKVLRAEVEEMKKNGTWDNNPVKVEQNC